MLIRMGVVTSLFLLLSVMVRGAATTNRTGSLSLSVATTTAAAVGLPAPCLTCTQTQGWIGAEWHPANASNSLWMAPAFVEGYLDGPVDGELAAASALGLTALRVYLHTRAFDADPSKFRANLDKFLALADRHGLGVGLVFFDDCWQHAGASTTVQCPARPGLHNACSMASPPDQDRTNVTRFEPYVRSIIKAHQHDPRVRWWELFNEPWGLGDDRVNRDVHPSEYSVQLRHAAFGWATAIDPIQPITSCWDRLSDPGNLDAELQNVHHYGLNFHNLTEAAWQGLAYPAGQQQGSLISEAGCRWFQDEDGSNGSPLEMVNWLHALQNANAPYIPGMMLSWTVSVGNDNTRWHSRSQLPHANDDNLGAPEPAIPWCGLQWPDGYPVSYTEAHAIAAWTGKLGSAPTAALPTQLWATTWLAETLAELRAGQGGSTYLTVPSGAQVVVPLNASTAVTGSNILIEATIWPLWPNNASTSDDAAAVGVLAQASGRGGLFAGVTANNRVVLEQWATASGARTPLAAFPLASLPPNQEHAAVNGWNMLRLEIRADGKTASVWWNPTHADEAGFQRGQRLTNVAIPPPAEEEEAERPNGGGTLAAAVCGGAALRLDYVGVYKPPAASNDSETGSDRDGLQSSYSSNSHNRKRNTSTVSTLIGTVILLLWYQTNGWNG